jgi:serine/threonine protein kinase
MTPEKLPSKDDIALKFMIKKFTGEGSQFVNYKVSYNGNTYLLKIEHKQSFAFEHQMSIYEIINNSELPHKLYFIGEYDNHKAFCFNYFSGLDMFEYFIRYRRYKMNISENFIKFILKSCLLQIHELNKNNIIHLDIKPENILINLKKPECNIIDFGLSKVYNDEDKVNIVGTYMYIAPEILGGLSYHYVNDIWSLGITIFEIIFNHYPFNLNKYGRNDSKNEYIRNGYRILSESDFSIPETHNKYSFELLRIIASMLTFNYLKRPTALELLNLDYFKNFDVKSYYPTADEYLHYSKLRTSAVLSNRIQLVKSYNKNINVIINESLKSLV